MRRSLLLIMWVLAAAGASGENEAPDAPAPAATAAPASTTRAPPTAATPAPTPVLVPEPAFSPRPARPHPVAPATTVAAAAQPPSDRQEPAKFSSDAKWDLAGYNNDEVIYTIFITNHDSRIIRCSTELKGFYYEGADKIPIADRQSTTVFPDQRVQAGNWQGMDEKSGATYAVKCHAL